MNADTITAMVLTSVRRAAGRRQKPIVTREFSLGDSSVRADLAILGDEFIGVEVKGQRDTLRRLPTQMKAYTRHFDRTIVVVANRHLKHIARDDLCGAALWSFDIEGNLTEIRAGSDRVPVDAERYLEMMTQEERRRSLAGAQKLAMARSDSEPGVALSGAEARAAFFEVFRNRYAKISADFWNRTARRAVRPDDLPVLSRFQELRSEARRIAAERDSFWRTWAEQSSAED
jgi:hypothetical protein